MIPKKLILALFLLLLVFSLLWLFSPHANSPADVTTTAPQVQFESGDVILPQETTGQASDVPENYKPVADHENVYAVMDGTKITGYKEKLSDGSFVDFDINIPENYQKLPGSDTIYQVVSEDGTVLQYRRFNGKEWDIVDKEGNIVFAIPDGYTRENAAENIYLAKTDTGTVRRKIVQFTDGSYAWQTVTAEELPGTTKSS